MTTEITVIATNTDNKWGKKQPCHVVVVAFVSPFERCVQYIHATFHSKTAASQNDI